MDTCPRCDKGHCTKGPEYWAQVRAKAQELKSDGCTWALEIFKECCWEHDVAYRTGANVLGEKRSQLKADNEFRECMQCRSVFRWLSPISWWRWVAVRFVGGLSYRGKTN